MREDGVADVHTHTMYSGFSKYSYLSFPDSVTTPKKSVQIAQKIGLDLLCITDHNTIKGAVEASKYNRDLVVIGEEIRSKSGEIIGLFLQEEIKPGLSAEETIEQIHEQDGIAFAPHPFSVYCPCVGNNLHALRLDGIEVFNSLHRDGFSNALALESCNGHAKLGGSDAHSSSMIGNGYSTFSGNSQEDFHRAIKKGQTSYGGKPAPLKDIVNYSIRVAYESSKMLLNFNNIQCPMYDRISELKKSRKMMYLMGSFAYAFSPLPVVCTLIGNKILSLRGKKNMIEQNKPRLLL
ncbi:MAG: PHP domain-containing protein [Euryarchaeota archaeon]|nr:PHP domain-containing protein [Euryarchaeota archaeon]MBU4139167.1 PHP domain-containing protein [Euryarchaeota archaeon]